MTLLVDLDDLKTALGVDGTDEDDALELLEGQAAAWVEGRLQRRFQSGEERKEYVVGSGTRTLYLNGHIADTDATVAVRERALNGGTWEDTDDVDFERRGDTLVRLDALVWSRFVEYELTYDDGYSEVPGDIQALVIELVGVMRGAATAAASVSSGTAGLKSETIGEFSQTFDTSAATSAASASSSLGETGLATINRWRRGRI